MGYQLRRRPITYNPERLRQRLREYQAQLKDDASDRHIKKQIKRIQKLLEKHSQPSTKEEEL